MLRKYKKRSLKRKMNLEKIKYLIEHDKVKIINEILNDNICEIVINGNLDAEIIDTLKNKHSIKNNNIYKLFSSIELKSNFT